VVVGEVPLPPVLPVGLLADPPVLLCAVVEVPPRVPMPEHRGDPERAGGGRPDEGAAQRPRPANGAVPVGDLVSVAVHVHHGAV
jgi:hypothetical protein